MASGPTASKAKNVFPVGAYTNPHTQYLYTAGCTDQQLQTCSVFTQTPPTAPSGFPLLLVRMKICMYIPMCMTWIPPAAGLRHSSRVSQVAGVCVYEPPKAPAPLSFLVQTHSQTPSSPMHTLLTPISLLSFTFYRKLTGKISILFLFGNNITSSFSRWIVVDLCLSRVTNTV